MNEIAENLAEVRIRIAAAAERAGRDPQDVKLIAVTKTVPAERIVLAAEAGVTDIGENRVQEILEKYADYPAGVNLHMIGSLQTNKVKYITDKVCMVQSLDRLPLAAEISKRAEKQGITMHALIEVNIGREESKGGVLEEDLEELVSSVSKLPGIVLDGLMTVAPIAERDVLDALFGKMRVWRDRLREAGYPDCPMTELSMGMSGDFEAAIENGATMVRIGSAIFGARNRKI